MSFKIIWTENAVKDLKYWQKYNQKKVDRIRVLCQNMLENPMIGIGKPEKLKYLGENIWSRRIDQEHRLVYEIKSNNQIFIIQARYHY